MQMNKYMTPEDLANAEAMAGIDDPEARMDSMAGLQGMANGMRVKGLNQYGNGRVIGATSPLDALGGVAMNAMGAYAQKGLADKYGSILDKNNMDRMGAARKLSSKYLPNALRTAGVEPLDFASYYSAADSIDQ